MGARVSKFVKATFCIPNAEENSDPACECHRCAEAKEEHSPQPPTFPEPSVRSLSAETLVPRAESPQPNSRPKETLESSLSFETEYPSAMLTASVPLYMSQSPQGPLESPNPTGLTAMQLPVHTGFSRHLS